MYNSAFNWGHDMITGFINGIIGMFNNLINTVANMANTVASYLHFSRPDVGPLRDYEEWMPDMVDGMIKSLKSATPRL